MTVARHPHRDDPRSLAERPRHHIGLVVRHTGLTVHVLRAWERRYGVVRPTRSIGGVRLYSDAQIERLSLIGAAVAGGRRIGSVASLSLDELRELVRQDARALPLAARRFAGAAVPSVTVPWDACIEAARQLDGNGVHAILVRAVVALSPIEFAETVAVPLLRQIGTLWAAGELSPAHEHIISVALRRVLGWLMEVLPAPAGAPRLVFATPAGQRHEFGAMLASTVAAGDGWRVTYLGADLPADEIAAAARTARADGVALSVVGQMSPRDLRSELTRLRQALPTGARLVAGGDAVRRLADAHALGIDVVDDYAGFREWLRTRAAVPGGV